MKREMMKMRAHRRPNDLRVPEIDGSWQRDRRINIEGCRRAKDGPDVARILKRVEHEHTKLASALHSIERPIRHLGNCKNALWRFRLRSASELRFLYYCVVDP